MRKEVKIILFMVALVLGFSVKINYLLIDQRNIVREREVQYENVTKYPKKSGYYELPFIHVDRNWSWTVALFEWCSGDGSWQNPYTIENITIDANGSPTGILINNSRQEYFTIRNCIVFNSGPGDWDAGIKLEDSNRGTLVRNNCSNNGRFGLFLDNCDNITVSKNYIYDNDFGISTRESHDIKIVENNIYQNGHGLGVGYNSTISRNYIYNNTGDGLRLSGDGNTISDNTINNNNKGIFGSGCEYNLIIGNKIYRNDGQGIYLWQGCWYNTIVGNLVYENGLGIRLESNCEENYVYNNFLANSGNAMDYNNRDNYWNTPLIGNYWSDYDPRYNDTNGDGIGDSSHHFFEDERDDRPIMNYSGFISSKPDDFTYEFTTTGHYVNWRVIHPNPVSYEVRRNGTRIRSGVLNLQMENITIFTDGLIEGEHLFTLEVEQTVLAVPNSDEVVVRVVNSIPSFTVKPANLSYEQGQTGNILSWTFSDASTDNPRHSIFRDGIPVILDNPCVPEVPIELNVDGLYVGVYVFTIIVEDGYGKTCQDIIWVGVTSSLSLEIIDQFFSTEIFNITYLVRNQNDQGIDFATMQAWWNGTDVSTSVQNLGGGIYFISLNPITVVPGEDPILLNMTVSASGYSEKYFETYIAVDPDTLTKDEVATEENIIPIIITISTISIFGGLGVIGIIVILLRRMK